MGSVGGVGSKKFPMGGVDEKKKKMMTATTKQQKLTHRLIFSIRIKV